MVYNLSEPSKTNKPSSFWCWLFEKKQLWNRIKRTSKSVSRNESPALRKKREKNLLIYLRTNFTHDLWTAISRFYLLDRQLCSEKIARFLLICFGGLLCLIFLVNDKWDEWASSLTAWRKRLFSDRNIKKKVSSVLVRAVTNKNKTVQPVCFLISQSL